MADFERVVISRESQEFRDGPGHKNFMKRELSQEELAESWTLPFHEGEVSEQVIGYLVQQTKTLPSMWADYDWQGRTIKYHRAEASGAPSAYYLRAGIECWHQAHERRAAAHQL